MVLGCNAVLGGVEVLTRAAAVFGGFLILGYQKSSAAKASHCAERLWGTRSQISHGSRFATSPRIDVPITPEPTSQGNWLMISASNPLALALPSCACFNVCAWLRFSDDMPAPKLVMKDSASTRSPR